MGRKQPIVSLFYFFRLQFVLAALSILIMTSVWLGIDIQRTRQEERTLESLYLDEEKENLVAHVDQISSLARSSFQSAETRLRDDLTRQVDEGYALLEALYQEFGNLPRDRFLEIVRPLFNALRSQDSSEYFFIEDIAAPDSAIAIVLPGKEGENRYFVQDVNGFPFIREMVATVRAEGAGFVRYFREKPGENGVYPKLSYVRLFEPLEWMIGYGGYIDETEALVKENFLDLLNGYRFDSYGYAYVLSDTGTILAHAADSGSIGNDMTAWNDEAGDNIWKKISAVASGDGQGFIEYGYPKPGAVRYSRKLVYIRDLPDFGWIIGAGFYRDGLETYLAVHRSDIARSMRRSSVRILSISTTLFLVGLVVTLRFARKLKRNLFSFYRFFHNSIREHVPMDTGSLYFREFGVLALGANLMARQHHRIAAALTRERERYREADSQKALLLREIHHRIKNSLALVSSVVGIESAQLAERPSLERAQDAFTDIDHRIRSVALIHEMLYGSFDFDTVDFYDYCTNLVQRLTATLGGGSTGVDVRIEIGHLRFKPDIAVPLGLMLAEMITNAFKYGEVRKNEPFLDITLREKEGLMELAVSNSGPLIAPHIGFDHPSTIGLMLINSLAEQLGGRARIDRSTRTCFIIGFPRPNS